MGYKGFSRFCVNCGDKYTEELEYVHIIITPDGKIKPFSTLNNSLFFIQQICSI